METKILAAVCASRDNWELVSPHITDDDLTPEGILVWDKVREYYRRDDAAKGIDMELLTRRCLRLVEHNAKQKTAIEVYLQRVGMEEASSINTVDEVLEHKRTLKEIELADALLARRQDQIPTLMEDLSKLHSTITLDIGTDDTAIDMDVSELLDAFNPENLIGVSPKSLNKLIGGGALRGHHILLAAMPETGKSLFALQMAAGFVMKGHRVLYVGNEDPIKSLVLRFMTNLTGMSKDEIRRHPDEAMESARRKGYGLATFVGLAPGTPHELRALITKYRPTVLIVDQLRNIRVKSENRTNQLEAVARMMRDFAREYDLLAVSVTQAADSARDKLILGMGDIDGSNIGIPGACDVMIMIGMDETYYGNNERMVTLAKNKLTGDHSHWPVRISKELSRVMDINTYIQDRVSTN